MAGDNGPEPRLIYQPQDSRISIGDEVATSGTGGLFPRGLRIGVVTGDAKAPRVKLRASLDGLEYVSILFFEDPSLGLLGEGEGGKSPSRLAVSPHPAKEQKR
jgi:rod shape-determining protein MreC